MENNSFIIFSHLEKSDNLPEENSPPLHPLKHLKKRQKPQISSISGVSVKEPRRYQITIDDEIVATRLTSAQAFEIAKGGEA
jgi:hypothetical protein